MLTKIKSSLYRNSFVLILATLISGLLGYLFHVVVARQVEVAQYGELVGLLALFNIIVVFAGWLSYFGVKYSAVFAQTQDTGSSRLFLKWLNGRVAHYTGWGLLVFMLISLAVAKYLQLSELWGLLMVGLAGAVWIMAMPALGVLTGWERFASIGFINTVGAGAKVMAGAMLVWLMPVATVVSGSFLLASIVVWGLLKYASGRYLAVTEGFPERSDWQEKYFGGIGLKKSAALIFSYAFLIGLLFSVDLLVVRHLFSPEASGYYGALSLLGKVVLWINISVVTVVLPRAVSAGYKKKMVYRSVIIGAYLLIVGMSSLVIAIYYWLGDLILNMFFGAKYIHLDGELWLFGVMALCLSLLQLESNFAFARDDWRVLYVLIVTIGLVILAVYFFNNSIREVVVGTVVALFIGYVWVFCLNLFGRSYN